MMQGASRTTPPPHPLESVIVSDSEPTLVLRTPAAPAVTPPPAPKTADAVPLKAEVRRLGPNAVAFRLSPRSRWVLFTSPAPIQVRRVDSLEDLPEELRDVTIDITVAAPDADPLH
jgi:hypothetical protein